MKNVAEYLQSLEKSEIKESKGKVQQVHARTIKSATLTSLMKDFQDLGFEVGKVQKGFVVRVPNDTYGSLVIQVDTILKPLDYDFDNAVENEKQRIAELKSKKAKKKSTI